LDAFLYFWSILRHLVAVSSSYKFLLLFWQWEDRTSRYILIIKASEIHHFSNVFWYRSLHVSGRFTVHHQESSTVYTATGICHTGYVDWAWPR
jgi:hypothetical protein